MPFRKFSIKSFLKVLPAYLPTIWIPVVVNWLGEYIGFVTVGKTGSKSITVWGWIVTAVVFILVFAYMYKNTNKLTRCAN